MSWTTDIRDQADFRRQAERAMSMPLGMVNPFWLIFGAAATAGVTWWWISRLSRAAEFEAARESASIYEMAEATAATTPIAIRGAKSKKVEPAPVDAAEFAEATEAFENADAAGFPRVVLDPVVPPEARTAIHESEIPAETSETPGSAGYPIVAPGPEAMDAADDLTVLAGIGPRIAAALAEHGVTRFAQLAAWSAEQLAAFDQEMNLRGRAIRSDWIEQARRLAAQ